MAKGEVMLELTENEKPIWADFFCTLVGWGEHPGYYRDNATKPTLDGCAKKADEMVILMRNRNAL